MLRGVGALTRSTLAVSRGALPLARLLATREDIDQAQLATALDGLFEALYRHPLTAQSQRVTDYLRSRRLIPNEQSTEDLLRHLVEQVVARAPMPVPESIVAEFWRFFDELFASPEIKGLGEISLDMARLVLRTYEPLLVEIINLLKAGRRFNEWHLHELGRRAATVRQDVAIVKRQIRALRYIKPFFATDPRDHASQARIVAQLVAEFGPFFIKMAQAAAANADFLPDEIARELAVFHEDVAPMSADEVEAAFLECFGQRPHQRYLDFDPAQPLRSGSIGSVFLAKKPFVEDGQEVLRTVVVKIGRQQLDREFVIGKLVLGLAIMSSQYWAPHSKLAPFLRAMQEQVDEFVAGFVAELDFVREADNQMRFHARSLNTDLWSVPVIHSLSPRIIEMAYVDHALSLRHAVAAAIPERRAALRVRVAEGLMHALMSQIVVNRELHGDLHPGNILVDADGRPVLIDWGNVIPLSGKWPLVRAYLRSALAADPEGLADALIAMSTRPAANRLRRDEVARNLRELLARRELGDLRPAALLRRAREGGVEALAEVARQRVATVMQLLSGSQHFGLVMHSDYLHLSRALVAASGSFATLFSGESRLTMLRELGLAAARLPVDVAAERVSRRLRARRSHPPAPPPVRHPSGALLPAMIAAQRPR